LKADNLKITQPMKLKYEKLRKYYKTTEAITHMNNENITNRFKAEFSQNLQKGQNITKPTVSKPFMIFPKLQNESYLLTQYYKTNRLLKKNFSETDFTK